MKSGASSLNPYAASYVPLFRRGVADANNELNPAQGLNSGNENVWSGHQQDSRWLQGQHQNVSQSYAQRAGVVPLAHRGAEFFPSTSQYPNEIPGKSNFDDEFGMDLTYLHMTFPGISEESLSDVYFASKCDLDAAVDMLNQLEIYPDDDSSDKLPDTLDIGDVPEFGSVSEVASQKVKSVAAEAGASTSGSSKVPSSMS